MTKVPQNNNPFFLVEELEERLEMTAVATEAADSDVEVTFQVGVDKNGPNAKVTLKWLF